MTLQLAGSAPRKLATLPRATSANSSRRSKESSRPSGPIARSSQSESAPEPTPASTTVAPGKMSANADDLGGILRVDDRGTARHRHDEVGQQRPQRQVLVAVAWPATTEPSGAPISTSCAEHAAVGVEHLAGFERDGVQPALGAGELHAVTRTEWAALAAKGVGHTALLDCAAKCTAARSADRALVQGRPQRVVRAFEDGMWAGTPIAVAPAATAEASPGSESSMATQSLRVDAEELARRAGTAPGAACCG